MGRRETGPPTLFMECEFIGGSRDGGTVEIPSPLFGPKSVFNGPVFFRPLDEEASEETGSLKVTREVYEMTEPGKLLFQGYAE